MESSDESEDDDPFGINFHLYRMNKCARVEPAYSPPTPTETVQAVTDSFSNREYYNLPIKRHKGETPGVYFRKESNKWCVFVTDRIGSIENGKQVYFYRREGFRTKEDALAVCAEKKEQENVKFWNFMLAQSRSNPLTSELPIGRVFPTEEEYASKTVFWRPVTGAKGLNRVERFVAIKQKSKSTGYSWFPACDLCNTQRTGGTKSRHCQIHMTNEEKSAHSQYIADLLDITKVGVEKIKKLVSACSECGQMIHTRRYVNNGGCGICTHCELRHANEAREAGSEPLKANQRWEDRCLDLLETLVNHPCESRDSMKDMLGSFENKRKSKRAATQGGEQQCDTTTKRRPDILYLIRDEETSRILVAITGEIEEDSHIGREIECELGKIDDTFEAIGKIGQREGFRDDRAGHNREDIVRPIMVTYKLNPNGTDVDCNVPLEERVSLLAKKINAWYETPHSEIRSMIEEGKNMTPIVECMFYHTKRAAKYLNAYSKAETNGAGWQWKGNTLKC